MLSLLCHSQPNVFANCISAAMLKVNFERDLANKASMEQAAGETLANEETKLNLWVNYLNVFATIGPMLGLLGTVTGIIRAFSVLEAGIVTQPDVLSGGISEALVTTAAGLLVAIPALIAHRGLRGHIDALVIEMEKQALALLVVRGARR